MEDHLGPGRYTVYCKAEGNQIQVIWKQTKMIDTKSICKKKGKEIPSRVFGIRICRWTLQTQPPPEFVQTTPNHSSLPAPGNEEDTLYGALWYHGLHLYTQTLR